MSTHAIQKDQSEPHFEETLCKQLHEGLNLSSSNMSNIKLYLFSGFKTPTICISCFCCLQSFCRSVLSNAEKAFFHISDENGGVIPSTYLDNLDLQAYQVSENIFLHPLYAGHPISGRLKWSKNFKYGDRPAHLYEFQNSEWNRDRGYRYPHLACCGENHSDGRSNYSPYSHHWHHWQPVGAEAITNASSMTDSFCLSKRDQYKIKGNDAIAVTSSFNSDDYNDMGEEAKGGSDDNCPETKSVVTSIFNFFSNFSK